MKNLFFALLLPTLSFAATNANLNLKGKNPLVIGLEINPLAVATLLPLDQTQNNLKVATGRAFSNSSTGFKISIQSQNGGLLKRNGGPQTFPYTLFAGGNLLNLTNGAYVYEGYGLTDFTMDLTLAYTGQPAAIMLAGDYLDTITFTIQAM